MAEASAGDVVPVFYELLYCLVRCHELALEFTGLVILDPLPRFVRVMPSYELALAFS